MEYTKDQIERASKKYNAMLRFQSINDYNIEHVGINAAKERIEYHNSIVASILAGNKELEKKWKLFFLNEALMEDQKLDEKKAKLLANKEGSSDILAPIKSIKKIGEFGKWLNKPGNKYRKEHFSKKYTQESVNAFLLTL